MLLPLGTKRITKSVGTKKITQPLGTKKNNLSAQKIGATTQHTKEIKQPLCIRKKITQRLGTKKSCNLLAQKKPRNRLA